MPFPERFFDERQKHFLSWENGPILAHMRGDGMLRITSPRQENGTTSTHLDIAVDGDAILYTQSTESFASFRLVDHGLEVTERRLDGTEHVWATTLPQAPCGQWILQDVIESRSSMDSTCYVLTVTDDEEDEGVSLLWVAEGAATHIHRPRAEGQVVHWAQGCGVVVLQEDRGPLQPLLHSEPLTGSTAAGCTREANWLDGHQDQALILTQAPEDPRLSHWDLRTGRLRDFDEEPEPVNSSRFFGGTATCALVITTHEGRDRAYRLDLGSGDMNRLEMPGAGRLLPRVATPRGIGLYGLSTTGGTSFWWIGAEGSVDQAPGAIPPDPTLKPPVHTYFATTPALVYLPTAEPHAAVISLHGGPESQERDELRWDGLYRDLLHAGVLVVGLNYTGSSGYGTAFLHRPWKDWGIAFQQDLEACFAPLRDLGVGPDRTVLLGGSFGGSLALLGCVLAPHVAGAVASAPLTDVRSQAARAAQDDGRYAPWFSRRYNLSASLPEHRTFDPEYLTTTGAGQRVVVIHGKNDQVTSYEDSAITVARAQQRGLPWSLEANASGHVPEDSGEARYRYEQVWHALTDILGL